MVKRYIFQEFISPETTNVTPVSIGIQGYVIRGAGNDQRGVFYVISGRSHKTV